MGQSAVARRGLTMRSRPTAAAIAQPLISVSIVSHGHASALGVLLKSLALHEPADRVQLIVTDNLGDDLPEAQPGPWHSLVTLRNARPRGFASNHNAAFQSASGTFFCVLNPDVVFLEGVFHKLAERLDQGEGDIAAPVLIDSRGAVQDSYRRLPSPRDLVARRLGIGAAWTKPADGALLYPDWIAGTFMLMPSSVFARLEGFDSRYRLYFEDVDFCTRARLLGLTVLVDAGLRLRHDPHRASRRLGRSLYWHVRGALRFFASDVYRRARLIESHA